MLVFGVIFRGWQKRCSALRKTCNRDNVYYNMRHGKEI